MRLHRCPTHPASAVGRAVPVGHMWRSNVQENAPTHDVVTVRTRDDIAGATRRALALLGGMPTVLAGRRLAVLKPNLVAGRPARTGATTSLDLIAAVAEAVHAAGATPLLCEAPGTEFDVEATYTILGLEAFCRQHDIGLVRPGDTWRELRPLGARSLKRFHVPPPLPEGCL